ncbi:NADPH-dependent ferric siderophore reductase [Psychromicrobium silvestre]|uniref:NADPH-dependent ferric siderophore reductase n=1 Tax=Psychromicrobium silvestre TaxID=1645614 RepID=A0A7Y9LUA9_9MICC|nr:siderophore-interacting protein [Psychromicrobium silvestre]NYE95743.1 NADPH-dependent ferric siderophore reductase [Psychromicrobium silvestre]
MSAETTLVGPEVKALLAFEVEVTKVQSLSPHFKRVTFTADQLRHFGADEQGRTLDLRIKVMIPSAGHPLPDFAALMELPDSSWYQSWLRMDPESRGFMRTYTVRSARTEQGEIDVDFVLHPAAEDGVAGPAGSWAERVEVGERVVLIGPNSQAGPCLGIEFKPGLSRRLLLVGDETAVPAIAAILESLEPDMQGEVILEVPEAADFQDLAAPSGVKIQWVARASADSCRGRIHGELLDAAVRAAVAPGSAVPPVELEEVNVDEEILWETPDDFGFEPSGQLYAWIAGEAAVIRELRRYLVREVGMDRRQVAFMGYWRQGKAEGA